MPRGPRLNNINKNFTTRDSLGIEGVATSISADICGMQPCVMEKEDCWKNVISYVRYIECRSGNSCRNKS